MSQTNLLIESLPEEWRSALIARCRLVDLPVGAVLFEMEEPPRYVHFPTAGIASVVTELADGGIVEVGLVGREGVAECLHFLGPERSVTRCFMQISGSGLRMDFARFQEEFMDELSVRQRVLHYAQYSSLVLSQLAACNRIHEVQERLARWLLMAQDKLDEPTVRLTQEFLAQMLGSRRSTVTLTAGTLEKAGFIECSRGRVKIVNRAGLEDTACECYPVSKRLLDNLYKNRRSF